MDFLKIFVGVYEVLLLVSIVSTIYIIDKPRKPITRGQAIIYVLQSLFFFFVFLNVMGKL